MILFIIYLLGVIFAIKAGFKWVKNIPPHYVTKLEWSIIIGLALFGSWITFFACYFDKDYPK